ncbi:MAG: TonB-dependent receptor [Burkholderiales bacterium PBB4]|nr:MAG: TonB-dependent receptor [Burkholderiales bacterium PBB4]
MWLPVALAVWATLASVAALAQTAGTTAKLAAPGSSKLPEVTITGNPLAATDAIAPVDALTGDALLLRAQSTLGETLEGTPGVSSSYFGPNASRPIIRGQEGDRIRILQNSGASVDASAVGGVVNVIDNRIAREPQFDNSGGISGKLYLGGATGNGEQTGALLLETGTEAFALHVDAFDRRSGDVAVPAALDCSKPGSPTRANAICNSSASSRGGAVGAAAFFDQGRVGASLSSYTSSYGTVAEDDVTIDMRSDRATVELELDDIAGPFKRFTARMTRSDYQHTEFEGPVAGTVFKNTGTDLRLVARHHDMGPLEGVVGLQMEDTRFSADGEEAFAPYSRTQTAALFALEELPTAWGRVTLGARAEQVEVESTGNPLVDRFVPGTRSFSPTSVALGGLWNVAPGWKLSAHLAQTERAPKDYELFANGPHIATHAFEIGDRTLGLEKATNLDVGVKWKQGAHSFGVNAFVNHYDNYLSLDPTGARDAESDLPIYAYTQVKARFQGVEAQGTVRLIQGPQTLDLGLRADMVQADNTTTGQPLPRIAPVRLGASLAWAQGPWNVKLDAKHVMQQDRVPLGENLTGAATMLNASLSYHQVLPSADLLWFAKLDNLGDTLAYSASSILTQTAPGKAPLPGRSLRLGVQVKF